MTVITAAPPTALALSSNLDSGRPPCPGERFISYDEVHDRTGLSRTTIWRLEKIKDFPQSVRISPGRRAWRENRS
jgi:predicted DNA-binding transcriptional regulator AlpA